MIDENDVRYALEGVYSDLTGNDDPEIDEAYIQAVLRLLKDE